MLLFLSSVYCQTRTGMPGMPMGMGLALGGVELSAADYMALDNAVKFIVDPTASPSPALLMLASQQGSIPNSAARMMSFLIPLQAMARSRKISVPGVVGEATPTQINDHVMQKALQWMQQRAMIGQMTENPDLMMRMHQGQRTVAQAPATTGTATQSAGSATTAQVQASNFFPMMAMTGMEMGF